MNATVSPVATPKHSPSDREPAARRKPTSRARAAHVPAPTATPQRSGATTLFAVSFASAMSDADIAVLASTLGLVTHMYPKLHDSPTSPGVVRLDFDSGLFLTRGPYERQWVLEGRTWGHPSPSIVHEWHLSAAAAAHQLDPTVAVPKRLAGATPGRPTRPGGWAANKRLARIGRRHPGPGMISRKAAVASAR